MVLLKFVKAFNYAMSKCWYLAVSEKGFGD
jgi:hypothetical protein